MNKYKALSDWLKEYVDDWIYFNVSNVEANNISLNSVSDPRYIQKFIDGSGQCELSFAIDMIKPYDTGTSDLNLDAIQECTNLMEWCERKNSLKQFPDFGDCIIDMIEFSSTPDISVDETNMLAKYQILGKVTYLDLKGE